MSRLAGHNRQGAGQGFTLVELLLTTALMLLLVGAAVFSFTTLQRGSELDEGARQMEALLRFARAQAEATGRQVQISFDEEVAEGIALSLGGIRVLWEPDPVGDPGTLVEMPEAASFVRGITDLVEVEGVRLIDANTGESVESPAETEANGEGTLGEEMFDIFPPVTFQPDGSGDSAEIMLRSRDVDDRRRVAVRIVGLTGSIRREFISREPDEEMEFDEEPMVPEPSTKKSTTTGVSPAAGLEPAAPAVSPTPK
jgi:prepilin-type N-terminal cleavage/methylation domain-containing protein